MFPETINLGTNSYILIDLMNVFVDLVPVDLDFSRGFWEMRAENVKNSRFSSTIRAEKAKNGAFFDCKINFLHSIISLVVLFDEVPHLDSGVKVRLLQSHFFFENFLVSDVF